MSEEAKNQEEILNDAHRRQSDALSDEIQDMIIKEPDEKWRQFLSVLAAINNSIIANTGMTRKFGAVLQAHLTNYEIFVRDYAKQTKEQDALKNKGIGVYRAAIAFGFILQVIATFLWYQIHDDYASLKNSFSAEQSLARESRAQMLLLQQLVKLHTEEADKRWPSLPPQEKK